MSEVKDSAAEDERHIEEAREWMKTMIENNLLPIMTIAKLAGIKSAAVISKFYHKQLRAGLAQPTATKVLAARNIFDRVGSIGVNNPTTL